MMDEKTISWNWALGRAKGDRAKNIANHAHAGIGYYLLEEEGKGNTYSCLYAFKFANDKPFPEHLEKITDMRLINKLEKLSFRRSGNVSTHEQ